MKANTLVIVGCGKAKREAGADARDLYTGPLFKAARRWAESFGTRWLIASAEHRLVWPTTPLEPYDTTLKGKGADFKKEWRFGCSSKLQQSLALFGWPDHVVILAGADYVDLLTTCPFLKSHPDIIVPLAGLGIGHRLQWLGRMEDVEKKDAEAMRKERAAKAAWQSAEGRRAFRQDREARRALKKRGGITR